MITALLIVAAWCAFLAVTMAFFVGADHSGAPKPPITQEQRIWLKAVAKVAQRRSA
jgi:hypothetical protein